MKRRSFLNYCMLSLITATAKSNNLNLLINNKHSKCVKFGVISDVHKDSAYDAEKRLKVFIDAAKKNNVDFIIQLGDFCRPLEENIPFRNIWNSFPGDKYHVLGNHDMDICTKEEELKFLGSKYGRYYSFDKGDFHFVVLDPNNLLLNGEYVPYGKHNYFSHLDKREYMDPEQLEWLTKDLASTNKRCFIFSHESFENVVSNRNTVRRIFEDENSRCGFNKIVAAFAGHRHTNYVHEINGITYIQINSASHRYVGPQYACPKRFSKEINKMRPGLKNTLPYKDALFAIVTVDDKELKLKGRISEFIPPTPEDLHVPKIFKSSPSVPWIKDFKMKF